MIFSTRSGCNFTSSPLFSSVFSHLLYPFLNVFLHLLHPFRVYFILLFFNIKYHILCPIYTNHVVFGQFRNGQPLKFLIITSAMPPEIFYTRFECSFTSSPLVSSVFLHLPTRFECAFTSSPLVSSVFSYVSSPFRTSNS